VDLNSDVTVKNHWQTLVGLNSDVSVKNHWQTLVDFYSDVSEKPLANPGRSRQ